ncbi:(2Fe-2S) ferredoxin domain-containing protein [Candidatus Oscillochloris fontis]|uniref:(2Fe-2S) ferredoxin domain-containing protein n=1 Tax=Candidatus Oscillochloris fontis TaxID=2496868 RepID=UPI00101CF850|nr:(2Fe-2S) ferredoxin domain-containing protein [Candidatus Oscillochloris fontis]
MGKHDTSDLPSLGDLHQEEQRCLAICAGKKCAKAGSTMVLHAAQGALQEAGLDASTQIVLTQCQDQCEEGPVVTVLPGGYPYLNMRPDWVRQVVASHIRDGVPVADLLPRRWRRRLERGKE